MTAAPAQTHPFDDHQNMMDQLGVKAIRPGPNPNDPSTSDEANANPFASSMPSALKMNDGTPVTTAAQWPARRAEIAELFEREVYGRIPPNVPAVDWKVTDTVSGISGGVPIITRTLIGHVDNSGYAEVNVDIQASVTVPAQTAKPVPVMVAFGGFSFGLPRRRPGAGTDPAASRPAIRPPVNAAPSWQDQAIARGWGYAIINPTTVQPDNNKLNTGIIGLTNRGKPRTPEQWGALRAWQWGVSRLIDCFEAHADWNVDAKHIGIEGLSRYGKAALVTEAFEPRIAVGLIGSSGEGGSKLFRHIFGEGVENLAGGEYYWMAGNFIKYGATEPRKTANDLPVDSHELIAMCAPRPCFISYGVVEHGDAKWVDAHGSFMAAVLAGRVYELLGAKGLGTPGDYLTDAMPPTLHLIGGQLAWRQHEGGHDVTPNWPAFFDWVGTYIPAAPLSHATTRNTVETGRARDPRAIDADMSEVAGPRDLFWQDCVGADHPGILLRKDNLAHLRIVRDELGFKYIRFHGIFADDMDAYHEVNGSPVYNFEKIDAVYAAILQIGMRPFVEISFMPHDLATSDKTIFYWKGNGSPPKDYGRWADFISAFTRHLETHFGKSEIGKWRFEVWNEPNLDGFWTGGNQQAYFQLYDATVKAIKNVDSSLLVGGPSTAGAAWVPEFIAHAKSADVPVDFITTHTYGVNGGFLDENGHGDNKLSPDPTSIVHDVTNVRRQITASSMPGLPLHMTEWSTSYNPRDPIHDDYLSAAFILEKLKKTEGVAQSMSYWTYTDLFEEAGPPPASFHGGFGLLNREGIRKASFFAYKYLNSLGPDVLRNADTESWLTRDSQRGSFAGLIWNYTTPDQPESDHPYFTKTHQPAALPPIELAVKSLQPGTYRLTIYRTGFKANDAYSQYIEWGLPKDLAPQQIVSLMRLSNDKPETDISVEVSDGGAFHHEISMRTNDVVLVSLKMTEPKPSSAATPAPRTDANSMLAHTQLIAKAKAGHIDLYFLGDSITRRWGCTDAVWSPMLANWKQNFFGWNAANFGWGGDRVENMLWRIQNGELDGVNPRVIVILAGTNNVGTRLGGDEKVNDVVHGVRTLIETCKAKAPDAKIILTAIFPRNDNSAVGPEISRINQGLERLSDGKNIIFVNINDKLADADGKLFDGMTVDKLHLTVKGYQLWADALHPWLLKFLGPPAQTDQAPPATGDPSAVGH